MVSPSPAGQRCAHFSEAGTDPCLRMNVERGMRNGTPPIYLRAWSVGRSDAVAVPLEREAGRISEKCSLRVLRGKAVHLPSRFRGLRGKALHLPSRIGVLRGEALVMGDG